MSLTIEERERLAYITNSPVRHLLAALVDAEWENHNELTHEIDGLKTEVNALNALKDELQQEISFANGKVERLEATVEGIRKLCTDV